MAKTKKQLVKMFIGHHVGITQKKLTEDFVNYMKQNGVKITPQQFTTLARLYLGDGISQKELAKYLMKDYGSVTRSINGLEKRDWVRREDSIEDRRTNLVFITDKGKEVFQRILPLQIERNMQILTGLSKDEIEQLITLLSTVRENCNIN